MGDSLIGRTAGFDPVSPGSSPGPPANNLIIIIKCYFLLNYLFYYFLVQTNSCAIKIHYINIFKDTLLEYNIIYDKLEDFKSGAICIPKDINANLIKYAVGFSHNVYKKQTAEKIAL